MSMKAILLFLFCILSQAALFGQVEICDNGLDDDGDGLVDLNDEDCICEVLEPVSYIPNPSFEEMECCPGTRSQLNCATDWIQASEPTTDFLHSCGWIGWDDLPAPRPFPDGEGAMGFRDGRVRPNGGDADPLWKEYAGACLLRPLLANEPYRFEFDVGFVNQQASPPINVTFFGTSNCDNLPFGEGDSAFGCPSNDPTWKKLGEVRVSGGLGNTWVNTFLEITPDEDIYAIAIGPSCSPITSNFSLYYFFDNLTLAELASFTLRITETDHLCSEDFSLTVPFFPNYEYQWYLDGVALNGEVASDLSRNYGAGTYEVRLIDGETCRISRPFEYEIPQEEVFVRDTICSGDFLTFGDSNLTNPGRYVDTLKNQFNCDSIITLLLDVVEPKFDTITASILEGERYQVGDFSYAEEGSHDVVLSSDIGCDILVRLELDVFSIFIPDAFSPNGDATNDIFRLFSPEGKIASISMQIFDRWGNLVHQGIEWDGADVAPGVYVYLVDVEFVDGSTKTLVGDVTLIE